MLADICHCEPIKKHVFEYIVEKYISTILKFKGFIWFENIDLKCF